MISNLFRRLYGETQVQWNQRRANNRDYLNVTSSGATLATIIGIVTLGKRRGEYMKRGWVWNTLHYKGFSFRRKR